MNVPASDVCKVLRKLKPNKACGPDGVHPRVLKTCAVQLCSFFSYIFNLSLFCFNVPSHWKTSCIVPVPKKKTVNTMNDLRPIALTSCIIKCFENF